jgi:hypothetical protein
VSCKWIEKKLRQALRLLSLDEIIGALKSRDLPNENHESRPLMAPGPAVIHRPLLAPSGKKPSPLQLDARLRLDAFLLHRSRVVPQHMRIRQLRTSRVFPLLLLLPDPRLHNRNIARALIIHLAQLLDRVVDGARQRDIYPKILELLIDRSLESRIVQPDLSRVVVFLVATDEQAMLFLEGGDAFFDGGPAGFEGLD